MIFPWVQAEVCTSPIHGRGLFTTEIIRAGVPVIEWTGQHLSYDQVQLLDLEDAWRVVQIGDDLYDFSPTEVPEDFVNHSCTPTLGHDEAGRLCALVDLPAGSELTFDYFTTDIAGFDDTHCECGTEFCRGTLTVRDFADQEFQRRSFETFAPHVKHRARQLDLYRLSESDIQHRLREALTEEPLHRVVDVDRGVATTLLLVQPGSPTGDVARTLEARIYATAPAIQQCDVDTAAWHVEFEDVSGFFLVVEERSTVLQPIAAVRFVTGVGTLDGLPNSKAYSVAFPGESLKAPEILAHDTVVMDLADIVVEEHARGGGVATSWLYHAILRYSVEAGVGMWMGCMNEAEATSMSTLLGPLHNFDDRLGYYDGVDTGYIFQWQSATTVLKDAYERLAAIPGTAEGLMRSLRRRLLIFCHGVDPRSSSSDQPVIDLRFKDAIPFR